jgi:hypothetical protein
MYATFNSIALAIGTAIASAIVNSGPIGVAVHDAEKLAPGFNHEQTAAQFNQSLTAQLARDLQDAAPVDTATKSPKTTIATTDKRVVSRMNSGPFTGSLVSEPLDYTPPASNGIAYAPSKEQPKAPPTPAATN